MANENTNQELVIVVNPNAGAGKARNLKRLERLINAVSPLGHIVREESLGNLKKALREVLQKKPKVIAIVGGDGSIHHFLNIVLEGEQSSDLPMLLPLKGGTMNVLAKDVHTAGDPVAILKTVHQSLENGVALPYVERGLLRCTVSPLNSTRKEVLYGLTFASGVIYNVLREYDRLLPSRLNASRLILKAMFLPSFRRSVSEMRRMSVKTDRGFEIAQDLLGVVVTTLNSAVLGWKPFWGDIQDPRKEVSLLASGLPVSGLVPFFPAVFWGVGKKAMRSLPYFNLKVGKVEVEGDTGFTLDGELFHFETKSRTTLEIAGTIKFPILS